MKVTFTMDQAGALTGIQNWESAAVSTAKKIIQKYTMDVANQAKQNLTDDGTIDRGQLRAGIQIQFPGDGDDSVYLREEMTGYVYVIPAHAPFVEFGTGPLGNATNQQQLPDGYVHGTGGKLPPLDIIKGWVLRKGIATRNAKDLDSIVYLIARKIAVNGLRARPFLYPALFSVQPQFEATMNRFIDTVKEQNPNASTA